MNARTGEDPPGQAGIRKKLGGVRHMERNSPVYQTYVKILERELVPAMGCTEPIAIAYCAAVARSVLGELPDRIHVVASGNIIKNVKSVVVPNTGGRRGMETAAAIGALGGDETAGLEVIAHVPQKAKDRLERYLQETEVTVGAAQTDHVLDIEVTVSKGNSRAVVRAVNEHTNLVYIEKNGQVLEERPIEKREDPDAPDYTLLNVADICEFARTCELSDVSAILDRQIACNTAVAEEGLRGDYGANVGRVLLATYGGDVKVRARAAAAAGSDARMNGCELPVVINSGSGNQGLTASLPVIEYAKETGADREQLYRALVISNLTSVHLKEGIGRLSAYCGAVTAGAGAGAGIAWLLGGGLDEINHTIVNTLANVSGIICDGAKASCAAKIATSVEAGILGYYMYKNGQQFCGGDGIVKKGVENTIENVARLGRDGMRETDREILDIMIGDGGTDRRCGE